MENMTKAELFQRKGSLKSKLMAALSLLLVSTIMLGSATFAWFTLSTAPEVKGMSTTVGSNGSLEIALRDYDSEGEPIAITSKVGDSYATTANWKTTNTTWGNIIDLSHADYGLTGAANAITLYPARLNVTESGGTFTVNLDSPLVAPRYGTDGRVANISKTLGTGRYTGDGFMTGQTGVRGIGDYVAGTGSEHTMTRAELAERAQTNMNTIVNAQTRAIGSAVNTVLRYAAALPTEAGSYTDDATGSQIVAFINSFKTAAENLVPAVGYGLLIEDLSGDFTSTDTPATILSAYSSKDLAIITSEADAGGNVASSASLLSTIIDSSTTALSSAQGALVTTEGAAHYGEYSVDALKAAIAVIFEYNNMYIGDTQLSSVSGAQAKLNLINSASDSRPVFLFDGSGAISDVAAITGKYSFFLTLADTTAYVTSVAYTTTEFASIDNPGYLAQIAAVTSTETATTYTTSAASGATYGFAIDLAFRSNAVTGLALQSTALERVFGDGNQSEELMGQGSTITADDENVRAAVYVAFINPADGTLYGIAKAGTNGRLVMQELTIDSETGAITLADSDSTTIVSSLTQNAENDVTAIVYLDGDALQTSVNDGVEVGLNLQFTSTVALTPMDYDGYMTYAGAITSGGSDTGETQTYQIVSYTPQGGSAQSVGAASITISDIIGGTFDADEGYTVDPASGVISVSDGTVTAVGAGTATLTLYPDDPSPEVYTIVVEPVV